MKNKNFEIYFDCGTSKVRAGAFSKDNPKEVFYEETDFFIDHSNINSDIQKIISSLEKSTKEYLDDVNLMVDSSEMLSVGISISKKIDGSKLKKEEIQFLIQDAKQQILKNYPNQYIAHIIIKNYTIDNVEYEFLPPNINCNFISLNIFFICISKKIIEYFKKIFFELGVSVNQIFCSSYSKSLNYKNQFLIIENISFIDIGLNKTSITCYRKNEIIFFDVLPIGSHNITKDISKILNLSLLESEKLKISFNSSQNFISKKNISQDLIQQIIFARIEEILELSIKTIKSNLMTFIKYKMILMGEGSKILANRFKEKIFLLNDVDLLEETLEDICQSALKQNEGPNSQEVVIIPKKQIKQGFFEKLFHFFN